MIEFSIGDKQYRTKRLNAFQQFDIAKPLFPVLSGLVAASRERLAAGDVMRIVGEAVSEMPDDAAHKVLKLCLAGVERQSGNGWAAVYLQQADRLLFEDINVLDMLTIAMRVIEDHLTDFFSGLPST